MKFNCVRKLMALSFLVSISASKAREFTNLEGQKMEAEIVSLAGENVIFKKANGKKFRYALAKLIEGDQEYIRKWVAKNVKYDITVTKCQETVVNKRRVSNDGVKRRVENRAYEVTVRNNGKTPLEGIVVCYKLFTELNDKYAGPGEDKKRISDRKEAKFELPSIPPRTEKTFTTASMVTGRTNSSQIKGDIKYVANYTIKLDGGNFHFYNGDQLVAQHSVGGHEDEGAPTPEYFRKLEEEAAAAAKTP